MSLTAEELKGLEEESIEQLSGRVSLGSMLIKALGDTPEEEQAKEALRVQQEQINALIAMKTEASKPEPVKVEMKPARFSGRAYDKKG